MKKERTKTSPAAVLGSRLPAMLALGSPRPWLRLLAILALALGSPRLWPWLPAGPLAAQPAPAALSTLEVALWPEYDRPEMLVIYRGAFTPETALPVAVEMRIPAGAGQPSAVAFVNEAGERLNQQYTTRAEGEWLVVEFLLNADAFQIEYYVPLAVDAAGQREYTFAYPADYAVQALSLEWQEPARAEGFAIDPPAVSRLEQIEGLRYHFVEVGPLAQGEARSWTVAYQKRDTALSLEAQPATAPAGASASQATAAAGREGSSALLTFAIAFVALAAVGAGAFWLGRQTQAPAASAGRAENKGQRGALFCHQCGAQLRPDADFCHRCGAAARR